MLSTSFNLSFNISWLVHWLPVFILILECFFVLQLILALGSFCTWVERKGSALIQDRIGANRAGAWARTNNPLLKPMFFIWRILGVLGVLNTLICDAVKAILKENFVPSGVSNFMHSLGPFLAVVPVFLAFVIVPLAPDFTVFNYTVRLQIAEGEASGVLFFLAMGAFSIYGIIIASFVSNNKYAVLGGLRAISQMLSYELVMGLSFMVVVIHYSTFDLYKMAEAQTTNWGIIASPMMCIAALMFLISGIAETKRIPFDLPESESELTAGYFTEYSGIKFLLFWLAEFAEIALVALILSVIFFGAWNPLPYIKLPDWNLWSALLGHGILMFKVLFFCTLQIVIRWTLPRFRFDQLMDLNWKWLLEIGFINVILAAGWKLWLS